MSFSHSFYKSDNIFLRYLTRFLLKKNNTLNKSLNYPEFVMINYDHVSNDILIDGFYEIKDLTILCEYLKSKKKLNCSIDVGGYLGNHSIFFSKYFKKVITFEPNEFSYELLKLNTKKKKNIKIYNCGLSDKNSSKDFYSYKNNYGGSSIIRNKNLKFDKLKAKFLKFDNLKIKQKIDLVKIDVEGHEINVLRGMSRYLKKNKPVIVFECQKREIINGTSKVIDFLKKHNYKNFYSIENNLSNNNNFFSRIFSLIKFFIIRKKYIVKKDKFEEKFYNFIIAEK